MNYQVMVKNGYVLGCYQGKTPYEAVNQMSKDKGFIGWEEYADYTSSVYQVDGFRIWVL